LQLRFNNGGYFGTVKSTFDYREVFKKSLRRYDHTKSNHAAPVPIYSTMQSLKFTNSFDPRRQSAKPKRANNSVLLKERLATEKKKTVNLLQSQKIKAEELDLSKIERKLERGSRNVD